MIAEAIEKIKQLADKATGIEVKPNSQDPSTYWMRDPGTGAITQFETPLPPRSRQLFSLDDLSQSVIDLMADNSYNKRLASPRCYVGRSMIVVLLDDTGRQTSRHVMPLTITQVWVWLMELVNNDSSMTQKEAIQALLLKAPGFYPDELMLALRGLKWSSTKEGESKVSKPGTAAMSMNVQRAVVSAAGDLPETVQFQVPVYEELNLSVTVTLVVDVDFDTQEIVLKPRAGDMCAGLDMAGSALRDELVEAFEGYNIPVYMGMPS